VSPHFTVGNVCIIDVSYTFVQFECHVSPTLFLFYEYTSEFNKKLSYRNKTA